ncbi:MAG: rlmH [Peptococcaceae bacterium]|jgi:23S rRNA (pseudouridine1915-N3)-methyltransferase|nr:rlmH [Peptococcaceae bacterium]
MQIKVITVGRLKEKYWREAVDEYLKRLTSFAKVEIIEVAEERISDNPYQAEIEQVKAKEGERILKHLSPSFYVIPLVIEGKTLSSEGLADLLGRLALEGKSQLAFVIGGSHGLSAEVIKRGDFSLSFSPMTFPHQLMRILLLEQVYRGFSIIKGLPYHK